jgi:NitT/TauT family transport system ATP-binding protein
MTSTDVALEPAPVRRPAGSKPAAIVLDDVSKIFGYAGSSTAALDRVSLQVAPGEFVCIVGASGCGKSTLLNLVAGLDQPSGGRVQRPAGAATLMFQDSALFPWLTVERNVELALRLAHTPKRSRRERVAGLLRLVRLEEFATKRPHELSGGMRQRVALARALAQERPILLMDEPFGALDAITRDLLHDELERVWEETGLTVLFVTHNVTEAVRLGDRVVVLSSRPGRVAEIFEVDVERPRRIATPEIGVLAGAITDSLRREVGLHGRP